MTELGQPRRHDPPALLGLVLAGGDSRRMGRDKAQLRYHRDEPQVGHAFELLRDVARDVYVSIRSAQAENPLFAPFAMIVDDGALRGPAAGLLAAWAHAGNVAWIVLATDLPFVDARIVGRLAAGRDAAKLATAFRHRDGTPEPLCTIWEPAARGILLERVRRGDSSLRRLLADGPTQILDLDGDDPDRLQSVDSNGQYETARAQILAEMPAPAGSRSREK
jgi:molybdopterin-guanine dinucleotide biosynthesis protein A